MLATRLFWYLSNKLNSQNSQNKNQNTDPTKLSDFFQKKYTCQKMLDIGYTKTFQLLGLPKWTAGSRSSLSRSHKLYEVCSLCETIAKKQWSWKILSHQPRMAVSKLSNTISHSFLTSSNLHQLSTLKTFNFLNMHSICQITTWHSKDRQLIASTLRLWALPTFTQGTASPCKAKGMPAWV